MSATSSRPALYGSALLFCLLGLGCTHARPTTPTLQGLRERAAAAPNDPHLQTDLALGEMFAHDGDPERVNAQLKRALHLNPGSVRLSLAAGLHADVHGQPAQALGHYLRCLTRAAHDTSPGAGFAGEVAAMALGGLADSVDDYAALGEAALIESLAGPGLSPATRYNAYAVRIELAQRRGDRDAAQVLAHEAGCLTEFAVAGPFGPRELLGFDQDHGVDPNAPLAAQYDLGPGRGERAVRVVGARGCQVTLGGGPLGEGGTSYAQTSLNANKGGRFLVRLETPNSAVLYVDGQVVFRLDRRRQLDARVQFVELPLSAGEHLLTLAVGTRHPNPALSLAITPLAESDSGRVQLPADAQLETGYGRYLTSAVQMSRGDVLGARQTLARIKVGMRAAPLLFMQRANVALSDPLVSADVRSDDARQLLIAALSRDEDMWAPTVQLARLAAENGRTKEAIEVLRQARERWPAVPGVALSLVELLRNQDWDAEADEIVRELREQLPHACAPAYAELIMLRRLGREREAARSVETVMACDARSNARYALLLRTRDFQAAKLELERLQAMDPPQDRYGWLLAFSELAKSLGDQALLQRSLDEIRRLYPRSASALLDQVDLLAAAGQPERARQLLTAAFSVEPAALVELRRVVPLLGGEHIMARYRRDGLQAIADYEKAQRNYPGPQVLVFDYMAVRVFDDGSSMELVHTIQKVQSDEAVDELGEVQVPDGARVLTLRVIKPDGRRLEPDQIGGKETISLPTVSAGDYVELEYLHHADPSSGFPGGYLGDRFYFRSFEVPFDYSHMIVVLPKYMPVQVDPRGPAPRTQERFEGELRILEFQVTESPPLSPEPSSVSTREFIPSVRVGVGADWQSFVEGIREALVDRDLHDPAIARLVRDLVGEESDPLARARRLYDWVLQNVENNDDLFSQAATMLRARVGSRARVLHYMLQLAGVPSTLALVRSVTTDATRSAMADENTYEHLMVRAGEGPQARWLFTVERGSPFGFVPAPLRGQTALLLQPGLHEVSLPAERDGEDRRELSLEITLNAEGAAHVDAHEVVHGAGAVAWRGQLESVPGAELERRFSDDYVARLVPGANLTSLQIQGREQDAEAIVLDYGFDVDVLGRLVPAGWALPALLTSQLAANYARVSTRTTTQLVAQAVDTRLTLRLNLPAGQARPELPADVRLKPAGDGRGEFQATHRFDGDTLVIERSVWLPIQRITGAAYPDFADFCRSVDRAEARELLLPR